MSTATTSRPLLVAIEGPSGAGKTTLAPLLARRLGGTWLPEAYLGLRPRPSLAFRTRTELVHLEKRLARAEGRRYQKARSLVQAEHWVIADTGFLGPLTYSFGVAHAIDPALDAVPEVARTFEELLARREWGAPDMELYVDVPSTTSQRRAASAAQSHPARFRHRHRIVGEVERALWRNTIPRAVPGLVRRVDGRGKVDSVIDHLVRTLARPPGPRPVSAPALHRLLSRILSSSSPVFPRGNR